MNIKTDYWIKPIPLRGCDWSAWDDDTYDGAPDSATRNQIGYGRTQQEAIDDLLATLAELSDEDYESGAEQAQRMQDAKEGFNDD